MNKWLIIGGSNIDIFGKSEKELTKYDSNQGKVSMTYGGVGRNIAHNLRILDQKISFMSAFSQDDFGKMLYQDCQRLKMDLKYSKVVNDYNTSIYLAILNGSNDMEVAINDMGIINVINIDDIKEVLKDFNKDDLVIVDTNLDVEIIEYILKNKNYLIAMDPISTNKIYKLKGLLKYIDIFKPNIYEALAISDSDHLLDSAKNIIESGVKELCITLNKDGVLYYDKGKVYQMRVSENINVVNTTGAGDAFFACYLYYRFRLDSIEEAVKYALVYSIMTLEVQETVNEKIEKEVLINRVKRTFFIKEEKCI